MLTIKVQVWRDGHLVTENINSVINNMQVNLPFPVIDENIVFSGFKIVPFVVELAPIPITNEVNI